MDQEVSVLEEQVVVFELAGETYGLEIARVREIITVPDITRVPGAPSFVRGIINLRGKVIGVVDLRRKFGLPEGACGEESRIVVVEVDGETLGMLVDNVSEVLRIPNHHIEPPSPIIANVDADYLRGVAKMEGNLVMLLDLPKLMAVAPREG